MDIVAGDWQNRCVAGLSVAEAYVRLLSFGRFASSRCSGRAPAPGRGGSRLRLSLSDGLAPATTALLASSFESVNGVDQAKLTVLHQYLLTDKPASSSNNTPALSTASASPAPPPYSHPHHP